MPHTGTSIPSARIREATLESIAEDLQQARNEAALMMAAARGAVIAAAADG